MIILRHTKPKLITYNCIYFEIKVKSLKFLMILPLVSALPSLCSAYLLYFPLTVRPPLSLYACPIVGRGEVSINPSIFQHSNVKIEWYGGLGVRRIDVPRFDSPKEPFADKVRVSDCAFSNSL